MTSSTTSHSRFFLIVVFVLLLGLVYLVSTSSSSSSSPSCKIGLDSSSSSSSVNYEDSPLSTQPSPLLERQCLTYTQRYSLCSEIRSKLIDPKQRKYFFSQFLRADSVHTQSNEVALYRIHRVKGGWSEDFWLNVCSWITEASGLPIVPIQDMLAVMDNPVARERNLYHRKYASYGKKVRDTWLYTLGGHEDSVPEEFQAFVKTHLEDELPRIFHGKMLYSGGYQHGGDLAAGLFLKVNPQYDWCWIFESDTRFAGTSWHRFLTMARAAGKANVDHTPIAEHDGKDGIGKDAHLIWFYPRLVNYGYGVPREYSGVKDPEKLDTMPRVTPAYKRLERQYWNDAIEQRPLDTTDPSKTINTHFLNFRHFYSGTWKSILGDKFFNGAFVPACGFSRKLAMKVWDSAFRGNGHVNQEIMLPVVAQFEKLKMTSLAGLKIPDEFVIGTGNDNAASANAKTSKTDRNQSSKKFPFQFYFGFSKRNESAPMYALWRDGKAMTDVATHYNGVNVHSFTNQDCLEDVLMHPVKY